MTTKYLDGVQQVEVVKGDVLDGTPVLLETIPYTAFTASGTLTKKYTAKLNRSSGRRSIIVVNTLNQPLGNTIPTFYDSIALPSGGGAGVSYTQSSVGLNTSFAFNSQSHPSSGAALDSFQLAMTMGATAPTSGNVAIYLIEL